MSRLYIIPTPVGNLDDITLRAIKVLGSLDILLAEDTRKTGMLLNHLGIKVKMMSHHLFNEHKTLQSVMERLMAGAVMGLVSDAGTPAVSDPGFLLVRECIKNNIPVECLPGATAFVPALVNSGLPADRFCFEGFLPVKKGRKTRLEGLKEETRTMIFYESPHKLLKTLGDMVEYFGADRQCCVSRELSKIHEENVRGSLQELISYYNTHTLKGEITLVVAGL
ncbi:MAG: 16S rRNA (cytidine(1402)-2'-O)-methyltransferase [Bacteroidetes bacterium]|nr:MAG: 16S rRNA (cytidine(1402)-2'-O)-methyltransferase [Bacteroidota bacterium]